jgi:PAS domain-containing protein
MNMAWDGVEEIAWRYLLADSNLVVLVFDDEGRVREASQYARQLLGPDLVGRPIQQVFVCFDESPRIDNFLPAANECRALDISCQHGAPRSFVFRS